MRIVEQDCSLSWLSWLKQTTSCHFTLHEIITRVWWVWPCGLVCSGSEPLNKRKKKDKKKTRVWWRRSLLCNIWAKMINSTGMLARQARQFMTSAIRRGGHHDPYDGIPGYNLPFSTQNRHKLLAFFIVYLGSGYSIPLLLVRHQLSK